MSCCNCNLFDLACLRRNAGIPKWVQDDNENLQRAYNDTIVMQLKMNLGACFDYFCELKQQIDDLIISKPVWWDTLINDKLLNYSAKSLYYYFMLAGLAGGGNNGTYTAETNNENIRLTNTIVFKQVQILWDEVKKWLDEHSEEYNIDCWLVNPQCEAKCNKNSGYISLFTTKTILK